jgi:putative methionine-R-sulfoxide reductase with GAF domain
VTEQPLDAVARVLDAGGEVDDVLRGVVGALVDEGACRWAGIFFVEEGDLVLGPSAGEQQPERRTRVPVVYEAATVAELAGDGADPALLADVASSIAAYCLVGWDTGGVPWDPDA